MRRVVLGLCVPLILVTAACSGSGNSTPIALGTLASVTVSGATSAKPVVAFKAPIKFDTTVSKVVSAGPATGSVVSLSSLVTVRYVGIDAAQDTTFATWSSAPSTFYVNSVVKGFSSGLVGKHVGDRVLICAPAKDAFGPTGNLSASVRPGDSVIFVVDITAIAPVTATPATVPKLVYDAEGNPSKFTADDQVTKTPTKLGVYPVVVGPGPVIKSGDRVSVEYFGQLYPGGTVFNGWTGQAFDAQLGANQVIPGWDEGLVGQRVGSRIVLVVPPLLGYKDKAQSGIPANSTLIFTIQILSVNTT